MKVKAKSTKSSLNKSTAINQQGFQREIKKAEKGPFYSILEAKRLLKRWREPGPSK